MRLSSAAPISLLFACVVRARPPVLDEKSHESPIVDPPPNSDNGTEWDLGVEYNRYLKEVVQVLESDPDFKKKLETADVEKIRDGSIAEELDFVHHNVRSQLDDLKRRELERLRHLAMKQFEQSNGIDRDHIKMPQHLEISGDTFETGDLKKLIAATTRDLSEADRKRREEFKKYEMEKKYREDDRLQHINDEAERKKEADRIRELETKHKNHEKPHHPLTKDQLEELWEVKDHMKSEDFDPKTFFYMHDINGDGQWDEDEVKMLFEAELNKVYDRSATEDDMNERIEEMERMREHVFKEADTDRNGLISFDEFLAETKRDEYEKDPGWDTLDEEDPFTDEEFRAYEMQRQREIQDRTNRGRHVPPGVQSPDELPVGAVPYQDPKAQPQVGIPGQPAYRHP